VVTRQLQVERRTAKVRLSKTNVLPMRKPMTRLVFSSHGVRMHLVCLRHCVYARWKRKSSVPDGMQTLVVSFKISRQLVRRRGAAVENAANLRLTGHRAAVEYLVHFEEQISMKFGHHVGSSLQL